MGSEKEALVTVKFTGTDDSSLQTSSSSTTPPSLRTKHARLQGRGTPVRGPPWTTSAIQFTNTDTSRDDVKFAATHAVWEAIGHAPASPPYIDADGVHFPSALLSPVGTWLGS